MSTSADSPRVATFKLPGRDYERLERIAREEDRTISAVLRLAVREYLRDKEQAV